VTCEHGNPVRDDGPFTDDQCYACWRKKRRGLPVATGVANRGPCRHLGKRIEYRAGCGGWRCRHECEAGEPQAVPGGVCQSCPKWEGE
jgi:hypothetical protein